jgi:hypothetical protein
VFACPLDTASVVVAADEDGESMRRLVDVMQPGALYSFAEIVKLCQANGCFDGLVGEAGVNLENANRVKLSLLLLRYDDRHVKHCRFGIKGKGHNRRYHIQLVESNARSHAPHAVSPQSGKSPHSRTDRKERAEHAERATQPADALRWAGSQEASHAVER